MPDANISTTHDPTLGSEGNCAWVSGTDPLFDKVADAWMKIMIEDFGTDHWYPNRFCLFSYDRVVVCDYGRKRSSNALHVPTGY